jgi:rubrerythrin
VKKFWATIAGEEKLHADTLDKIHKAFKDNSINISVDIQIETLKGFVSKINDILPKASSEDLTESEAYSIGATIEVELDESGFTRMIQATDEKLSTLLKMIENDTKKHRVMLVNYSRGIR